VRGFNDLFPNKLLVLVDGRSIYNASLGTVLWSNQDVVFDNIKRIEVIRGTVIEGVGMDGSASSGANRQSESMFGVDSPLTDETDHA